MAENLVLRGQTLSFADDPFVVGPEAAVEHHSDGAVLMEGGLIRAVGPAKEILETAPNATVVHYGDSLITAGFVDCHAHYPQLPIIASYGEQLLAWLEKYTFPTESRFHDPDHARTSADMFLEECLRNGITTSSVYATVHSSSVDAFFEAASERGLRMACGKVLMDRNAPDDLRDTAESGYEQSKALIGKWHQVDRCIYAITPRFAPTSTPAQLEAAGELWKEYPDTLMQTHLSENPEEVAWAAELFPEAPDYFGVYEDFGLTGPGAIFGHAIHLTEREQTALRQSGSAIAHCPTSNTFIGSGLFDMAGLRDSAQPVIVGLATDVAGGADMFLEECLRNGITTSSVYATVHSSSVDAFFEAASERGLRMACGKVLMDRNAPDDLRDTAESGYEQSKALIGKWHQVDRCIYAITPRFAPTSTPAQLEAAGELWKEYPDTLMQTHLSENPEEVAWAAELFPEAPDYFGVYEDFGLTGPGAIFGHAIHLTEREQTALRQSGSAIAHCPTSNTFIGSGLFDMAGLRDSAQPVIVGLATDVAGGSSMSMFDVMRTAYEIAQLRGYSLHPAKAWYLASVGSARAMRLDDRIGNLATGMEADVTVIDLASTPLIEQRMAGAENLWDVLFAQMILADDRAIRATYAAGRLVHQV